MSKQKAPSYTPPAPPPPAPPSWALEELRLISDRARAEEERFTADLAAAEAHVADLKEGHARAKARATELAEFLRKSRT